MSESHFKGNGVSAGIALAPAFVYCRHDQALAEAGNSTGDSMARFKDSLSAAARFITDLMQKPGSSAESSGILEAQLLMLEDPSIIDDVKSAISSGRTAEAAVDLVFSDACRKLETVDDPYISARASDLRDVKLVLLSCLQGKNKSLADMLMGINIPVVVIADEILPTDTAGITPFNVAAFATEKGGGNSHAAIIARKLSIPAVFSIDNFQRLLDEAQRAERVIVDGMIGEVILDPETNTVESCLQKMSKASENEAADRTSAFMAAVTIDGTRVIVEANIADTGEIDDVLKSGADGIGLFRTEFLLIGRNSMPDEEEQFAVYRNVSEAMKAKQTIVRTFDIGGDKSPPFLALSVEANPFLGYRGARLTLDREELLRPQVRAVLRASVSGNVSLMLPMVSVPREVVRFREIVAEEKDKLVSSGRKVGNVGIGIMVEVPSIALTLRTVLKDLDFVSIGTNDLTQYCLAADRNNSAVERLNDHLDPSIITLIVKVASECRKEGVAAAVCGEMAGDPYAIPLLVGAGIGTLSVSPSSVAGVKRAIGRIDKIRASKAVRMAMKMHSADDVRNMVRRKFMVVSEPVTSPDQS